MKFSLRFLLLLVAVMTLIGWFAFRTYQQDAAASRTRTTTYEPSAAGREREMADWDYDDAFRVYLGGDPNTAAIQIGMRDERLAARFGALAAEIKPKLDAVLERAVSETTAPDFDQTIESWLIDNHGSLSELTRGKIRSHILYHIQH